MRTSSIFIILVSSFLIFVELGCASRSRDAEERAALHLRIGTALLSQGKYPAALGELLVAQELDPKNPVIYNHLGLAYFVRERFDLAEESLREALKIKSDYTEARNNLGRILIERKQVDLAVIELKLALEDLTYADAHQIQLNLGYAYFMQNKFDDAIFMIKKFLRVDRENCFALTVYGRSLSELQKFELAAQTLDAAIRRCPENQKGDPLFFAAKAYLSLQDRYQAKARFEEYLLKHSKGQFADLARKFTSQIEQGPSR